MISLPNALMSRMSFHDTTSWSTYLLQKTSPWYSQRTVSHVAVLTSSDVRADIVDSHHDPKTAHAFFFFPPNLREKYKYIFNISNYFGHFLASFHTYSMGR